jgi:hypothetical protein
LLTRALYNLADLYRKRAKYQSEKMAMYLPMLLLVVIGAAATLLYGLALFVPLINLLNELSA